MRYSPALSFLVLTLTAVAGPSADAADAADARALRPLAVVEMFTSQGCDSCPPADALLGELARRDDVVALSVHVDYWDYIGWKDIFASKATTARQHAYARSLGARSVYTPQAVVGGAAHAVGSDRAAVLALVEKAKRAAQVPLTVERSGRDVTLRLPAAPERAGATIWLMEYDARQDVPIVRGENAGKTLSYYNVVRNLEKLGTWDGAAQRLPLPPLQPERTGCAVLVQAGDSGPILAAVKIDFGS